MVDLVTQKTSECLVCGSTCHPIFPRLNRYDTPLSMDIDWKRGMLDYTKELNLLTNLVFVPSRLYYRIIYSSLVVFLVFIPIPNITT